METKLSRRERQIMDILYEKGRATVAETQEAMHDSPGYSAVRTMMRILEEKGELTHTQDGARYIYQPVLPQQQAAKSALERLVKTFFGGSVERAVSALVSEPETKLSNEDLTRIAELIQKAKIAGEKERADGTDPAPRNE